MADNREIIYLAICNQIQIYHLLLEDSSIDKDNREMMSYILEESLKIEENMRKELQKETPIGRPKWNQK